MEPIKERTEKLFRNGHITKFIYIDDMFGNTLLDKEQCKNYIRNHLEEVQKDLIFNSEVWEEEIDDSWENNNEKYQEYFKNKGLMPENAKELEEKFRDILPNDSDVFQQFYYSLEEFENNKDRIINDLNDNNQAMILCDEILGKFNRNGSEILRELAGEDYVNCALFSHTFFMEDELDKWKESPDKSNIYVISKYRINEGTEEDIYTGLQNALWNKQISKLKDKAKDIIGNACNKMKDSLDNIDPSTFHKIVMDRSAEEGCWEFETLIRIGHAYMGVELKKLLSNEYDNFQKLTSRLREIKQDAKANPSNQEIVKEISREEIFEDANYINKTFSQISNGDIFEIGMSKKKYILLCQPCNLVIRHGGKRSYDFEQFYVIPIKESDNPNNSDQFVVELKHVDGETETLVALLREYKRISLSLLDLVSFNPEGKAKIIISQSPENHPYKNIIQNNMMERYKRIYKKVISYINKCKKIKEIIDECEKNEIIKLDNEVKNGLTIVFSRPYEMGDPTIVNNPNFNRRNNEIDFFICRVKRYKEPYARDLLQQFMNYLSRPAYPMKLIGNESENGDSSEVIN